MSRRRDASKKIGAEACRSDMRRNVYPFSVNLGLATESSRRIITSNKVYGCMSLFIRKRQRMIFKNTKPSKPIHPEL